MKQKTWKYSKVEYSKFLSVMSHKHCAFDKNVFWKISSISWRWFSDRSTSLKSTGYTITLRNNEKKKRLQQLSLATQYL